MTSPLRTGWIGCGNHANEMLLPQLIRCDATLDAICDISEENLALTARRYNIPVSSQHRDWRELLARSDLDAIGLSMGPAQHLETGFAAIERGLPCFMEKPPAPDAAGSARLAEAAKARGALVVPGFMKRYSTANRIAANIIHGGEFGQAASFLGEYMTAPAYFAKDADYSGFYLHHCIHYMDLVPWLMGEIAEMSVDRHELGPGKILLHARFRFESGGLGTLVMGTNQSRGTPMEWWQVMGDHKRVEVRNIHEVRYFRAPEFKAQDLAASLGNAADTLVWEPNLTVAANEDHKGYHALIGDFLTAARGGKPSRLLPSLADGAKAMQFVEQLMRQHFART